MFSIAINYLNGRVAASAYGSAGGAVEWPPHPDRVFMALVAAWGETGQDADAEQALRWLEMQATPSLAAGECHTRRVVRHFVPVNDAPWRKYEKDLDDFFKGKEKTAPGDWWERRLLQARQFATATLDNPTTHIIWPDADPAGHLPALRQLAASVTSVGHSSSLAQVWVDDNPPPANWRPAAGPGGYRMRVPYGGRLDDLATAYASGQRPEARRWVGYLRAGAADTTERPHSVFTDRLIVFEATGSGLDLRAASQLTAAFRNLILAQCPEPLPEWISGHTPDGGRSESPHVALIPLPFVGRQHANGRVMGLAIALPRAVPDADANRLFHNLLGYEANGELKSHQIMRGQWNEATLRQPESSASQQVRHNLQADTWTRPSDTWHTVTPVTLDRYYKGPDKARLERENVAEQCRRIGLPSPIAVALGPVSMLEGVPPAREFPRLRRRSDQGGNGEWQHTHATIVFAEPVRGPVILGSGRYRGYGLCRPA